MTQVDSTTVKKTKGGLEGVVAVQSSICFIDGEAGRLVYRGYEIGDLVEHATFEEVAHLLWDGELPNRKQLESLRADLGAGAPLSPHVHSLLKDLPRQTQPMDALRTAISAAAATDPDLENNDRAADRRKAIRIAAQLPTIVAAFHRLRNGQQPIAPDASLPLAANFLYMLNGKRPHETLSRVLDAALVLHAEHGMNASTFAARVTSATLADIHAAITSACAALKGPLHGGANQDVMHLLLSCGDAEAAERKVRDMLANHQKVPGFGHRVYRTFDPRAHFLRKMSKQLGEAAGNTKWYEMSERLIPIMKDSPNADGKPKNLNPNVDFFSASTYYTMGIPIDLFTPLFAIARVAGWTAHVMEQHENNRIIRPTDDYTGPFGKKVKPIDQRG
ncbi:MAG TPA: citrate/2-methylcitrate synthase [Tepidisphaeraceae bacterium]|nr:citrate/2-methylcitrate synthase [Tepidisphaeraceae bacterium]